MTEINGVFVNVFIIGFDVSLTTLYAKSAAIRMVCLSHETFVLWHIFGSAGKAMFLQSIFEHLKGER